MAADGKTGLDRLIATDAAMGVIVEPGSIAEPAPLEDVDADGLIPTERAARMLGVSVATLQRRAKELGAKRGPRGRLLFEMERLRIVRDEVGGIRKPQAQESHDGQRDSRVVAALESGMTIAQIVVRERVPMRIVAALREEWLKAAALDRKGVAFACSCGAPSNPHTAKCERCAPRTRVLSDEQAQLLAGHPIVPGEAACSCCGTRQATDRLDRICAACREGSVAIIAESGRLRVVLRTPRGPITLRVCSVEESRALAQAVSPPSTALPAPPPQIAEPAAPIALPFDLPKTEGSGVLDQIKAMRSQMEEVDGALAAAREQLAREG